MAPFAFEWIPGEGGGVTPLLHLTEFVPLNSFMFNSYKFNITLSFYIMYSPFSVKLRQCIVTVLWFFVTCFSPFQTTNFNKSWIGH